MKQGIRINESQLRRIVKESVNKILKESTEDLWQQLDAAKASGNSDEILDALHNLEAALESEGKLIKYDIPANRGGGYGKATAGSRRLNRFGGEGM